jgi:hypothetical protein
LFILERVIAKVKVGKEASFLHGRTGREGYSKKRASCEKFGQARKKTGQKQRDNQDNFRDFSYLMFRLRSNFPHLFSENFNF